MWRCLSSTAQVVQMALALALMPTCAAMCSGAQDEASNSSRQLHARQPVAIIVAGAARVLAKSSVARESLHTFIRSNNGTPFFAIHLQDACSGAKFSIGGRFGSSHTRRSNALNGNLTCTEWLDAHNVASGRELMSHLLWQYPDAGLLQVLDSGSTCATLGNATAKVVPGQAQPRACCSLTRRGLQLEPDGMPALQFYWVHLCFQAVMAHEVKAGMQFNWILRTRPDVYPYRPIFLAEVTDTRNARQCTTVARKSGDRTDGSEYTMPWDAFYVVPRNQAESFFASSVAVFERGCQAVRGGTAPQAKAAESVAPEYQWKDEILHTPGICVELRVFPITVLIVQPNGTIMSQCRRVARDEKRSCATRLKGSPFDLGREDVISADGPTTKAQGLRLASSLLRRASVWHGDYPAKRGTYRKNETSSPFRGQLEYMYAPVVSTLLAGLRAAPNSSQWLVSSHIVFAQSTSKQHLLAGTRHLTRGDMFIWVGPLLLKDVPFASLRARGVRVVYYQTEPLDYWAQNNNYSPCIFTKREVDEMWDFSWHNIDHCAPHSFAPVLRYVPLGALATPRVEHQPTPGPLVFLGSISQGKGPQNRAACFERLRDSVGYAHLEHVADAWTDQEYAAVLRRHSIFLNIHKFKCSKDTHAPVTWRSPKLLNAHALVISERCYERDEAEYSGMISFVEFNQLHAEYERLAALSTAERRQEAERRAARFEARNLPRLIFERAGIYELMSNSGGRDNLRQDSIAFVARSTIRDGAQAVMRNSEPAVAYQSATSRRPNYIFAALSLDAHTLQAHGAAAAPSAQLEAFFLSFMRHVPSAQLVVFARGLEFLPIQSVGRRSPAIRFVESLPPRKMVSHSQGVQSQGEQIERYAVFARQLAQLPSNTAAQARVAFTDALDVIFQSDPFSTSNGSDQELDVFLEIDHYTILSEKTRGNAKWIEALYGSDALDRISERRVSCSGFTMGSHAAMLRYAQMVASEVERVVVPRASHILAFLGSREFYRGLDQGIHNMLVHGQLPSSNASGLNVRLHSCRDGPVMTTNGMVEGTDFKLAGSRVTQMDGTPFAVVHQYNRLVTARDGSRARTLLPLLSCRHGSQTPDYCVSLPLGLGPDRTEQNRIGTYEVGIGKKQHGHHHRTDGNVGNIVASSQN